MVKREKGNPEVGIKIEKFFWSNDLMMILGGEKRPNGFRYALLKFVCGW
jgi:hypothetical protein